MWKIRSFDTRWERNFHAKLSSVGLEFQTHYGRHRIDVAFPERKVAVFLDSCFWHYCPRHRDLPITNGAAWRTKLEGNRRRDSRVSRALRGEGWIVLRVWSHEFVARPDAAIRRVVRALHTERRA